MLPLVTNQNPEQLLDLTGKIKKLDEYQCAGGGFGDIFRCLLHGDPSGPIEVAVKALRFSLAKSQESDQRRFVKSLRRELGIWKRLHHPNIVPFLGIAFGFGPHPSLVSVWMRNGTLQSFLKDLGSSLSIVDRFHLLEGVASGIQYLHSCSVIHGDLTSNNVLIDDLGRARLVDFGFASVIGDLPEALAYLRRSTQRPGATRWAAPEQFQVDDDEIFQPTAKSDIYSLGCIMLQVLSGKEPWSETKNDAKVVHQLYLGKHPGRPSSPAIEDEHWVMIEKCWLPVEQRLSAAELVDHIAKVLSSVGRAALGLPGVHSSPDMSASNDLHTFIRPYLDQYIRTPNRLAFGERTVIVMSAKVAQKSYGTEKRFLCPPPTAIMLGNSWWTGAVRHGEVPKCRPPGVNISISGEPAPPESSVEWSSASGEIFDINDAPAGTTYIGRCIGKQLFVSSVEARKKGVKALVKVTTFASENEPERVIGTFPSCPIKVISKPSKKRQSAKRFDLCTNHGSTISLFHRLRSQTASTRYLCVSSSSYSFKGSDGSPLMGIDSRARSSTPSFIARTASWDPFVMYIVDVNKPTGSIDTPPPPPPQPDYPSPPPNTIPFTNNGSQIPIYYNQTVVLQCLVSGVVTPVLVIRKVDHQTTVVGGGLQEGAKGVADHYCPSGEVCGDPVSQLHKIAFEVYDPANGMPESGTPGATGTFLSCMGEKVNTYRPLEGRKWVVPRNAGSTSPMRPGSPMVSTPTSINNNSDYFGQGNETATSEPASFSSCSDFSNDGCRVKKGRGSTSRVDGTTKTPQGRRRRTSASSATVGSTLSGALWQVDVGNTSIWTIVGTGQIRYDFYLPPVLFDNLCNALRIGSFPVPFRPVTPFPTIFRYLPPHCGAETSGSDDTQWRRDLSEPSPYTSKMSTVYGENFNKSDPLHIFFGSHPSPYIEVRSTEVMECLPPEHQDTKQQPIILVRSDGVVFPSNIMFP